MCSISSPDVANYFRDIIIDHHHHPRLFLEKLFLLSSVGELWVSTERSSLGGVSYDGLVA